MEKIQRILKLAFRSKNEITIKKPLSMLSGFFIIFDIYYLLANENKRF